MIILYKIVPFHQSNPRASFGVNTSRVINSAPVFIGVIKVLLVVSGLKEIAHYNTNNAHTFSFNLLKTQTTAFSTVFMGKGSRRNMQSFLVTLHWQLTFTYGFISLFLRYFIIP